MSLRTFYHQTEWLAVVTLLLSTGALARAQDTVVDVQTVNKTQTKVNLADGQTIVHFSTAGDSDSTASGEAEGWIGISLRPLGEALRSQLDLPAGHGMIIQQTVPDSPAAKIKLQQHDIIVKVSDHIVIDHNTLTDAIQRSRGKELRLVIIRGGKRQTVNVTPEIRSAMHGFTVKYHPKVKAWVEASKNAHGGIKTFTLNPRIAVLAGGSNLENMPGNLKVTITKAKDKPTKIHVERKTDDETESWEVTDKDLDKLPKDIRSFIQGMVGGDSNVHYEWKNRINIPKINVRKFDVVHYSALESANEAVRKARTTMLHEQDSLEKQIEILNRQMQQLMKEVRQMRGEAKSEK